MAAVGVSLACAHHTDAQDNPVAVLKGRCIWCFCFLALLGYNLISISVLPTLVQACSTA